MDDAQDEGGRLDGLPDRRDDEDALQRVKTRALVLQRRATPDGWAARSRRAPAAALPVSRDVLDAALSLVLTLTQTVVVVADGVSITLPRRGRLTTVAASDDVVLELDHEQYTNGAGPSLDATLGRRVHVDSLATETRWPAFTRKARARRVETILSTPLTAGNRPIGALTVYSHTAGSLAAEEARWAELFAAEASTMVAAAQFGGPDEPAGQRIRTALQAREAIAQAQGVIMQRDGVSARTAYEVLRDTSRCAGRPLRDIAAGYVASIRDGAAPQATPTGEGSDNGHAGRENGDLAAEVAIPPTASARWVPPTSEMSPRQPDGTIYLTVGGDWTQPAAGALRSLFDRVRRHRPTLVIADLSDVTGMDSTTLDALIEAHRGLAATGCRFELHNVPPHLGRQLQNTGLGRALPVTDATPTRRARPTAPAPTGRRAAPQPDLTPTAAGHIASGKGPHHAPAD